MDKTNVMVNGLPGKMASEVAEHIVRSQGFKVYSFSLTGSEIPVFYHSIETNAHMVGLVKPVEREDFFRGHAKDKPKMCVDFTHPSAVNANAELYCRYKLPFVMGTTGGDRDLLTKVVANSDISAVIAPNMAKQIVTLQALMEGFANENANSLDGYTLNIDESHQKGKADTSGTAKAMVKYFQTLGILFDNNQIRMIRNPVTQREIGVPEAHLSGHGWHRYTLESPHGRYDKPTQLFSEIEEFLDSSPVFAGYGKEFIEAEFTHGIIRRADDNSATFSVRKSSLDGKITIEHNVNGRGIYARGTIDALRFLNARKDEKGKVYSMIDVLKAS